MSCSARISQGTWIWWFQGCSYGIFLPIWCRRTCAIADNIIPSPVKYAIICISVNQESAEIAHFLSELHLDSLSPPDAMSLLPTKSLTLTCNSPFIILSQCLSSASESQKPVSLLINISSSNLSNLQCSLRLILHEQIALSMSGYSCKQESIPVECIPPACQPYVFWWPPLGVSTSGRVATHPPVTSTPPRYPTPPLRTYTPSTQTE